jgi:hypothetical protein
MGSRLELFSIVIISLSTDLQFYTYHYIIYNFNILKYSINRHCTTRFLC